MAQIYQTTAQDLPNRGRSVGGPRAEVIFQRANIARKALGLDPLTREQVIATDLVVSGLSSTTRTRNDVQFWELSDCVRP